MTLSVSTIDQLATAIIEQEATLSPTSAHDITLILRVCDKMHPPLSRLAGTIGYRALLSRALSVAQADGPSLRALRFEKDGRLVFDPPDPAANPLEPAAIRKDAAVLISRLLSLLMLLIGEPLTIGIVRQVWPEAQSK